MCVDFEFLIYFTSDIWIQFKLEKEKLIHSYQHSTRLNGEHRLKKKKNLHEVIGSIGRNIHVQDFISGRPTLKVAFHKVQI